MEMGMSSSDDLGKAAKKGAETLLLSADTNSDGEVQPEEAMALLSREQSARAKQDATEVKAFFTDADKDSSAGLNKEELAGAMEKWYGGGYHYAAGGYHMGYGGMGGGYRYGGGGYRYGGGGYHYGGMGYLMEMGMSSSDDLGKAAKK